MNLYVNNQTELVDILASHKKTIRRFGAKRLGFFKSCSHQRPQSFKDLGLLVEFAKGEKSYYNFVHLMCFLEDLLHSDVELITPDSISPYIRSNVLADVEYLSFEA